MRPRSYGRSFIGLRSVLIIQHPTYNSINNTLEQTALPAAPERCKCFCSKSFIICRNKYVQNSHNFHQLINHKIEIK
uniref:Uncharacterized protein n=1 Tax=Pararge aegeria TaxID=116150 RepID=S4P1B5_9NEOP